MVPNINTVPDESFFLTYPKYIDTGMKIVEDWLASKIENDGAEGLWRIHDGLYDFSTWIDSHPGGKDWLTRSKGTDITEAFESHHVSTLAEQMLPKYFVRKAKTPRNYRFTFHENGFYKTLKKRVRNVLQDLPKNLNNKSKRFSDCLLAGYVLFAILAVRHHSFSIGIISAWLLAMLTTTGHNFTHQRDNFRMFYFDFLFLSCRENRVTHILSHHIYPNTLYDVELSSFEPLLIYYPKLKSVLNRFLSTIAGPIIYSLTSPVTYIRRVLHYKSESFYLIQPFVVPLISYIFGGGNLLDTILMWAWIVTIAGLYYHFNGIINAHHHPTALYEGDKPRQDRDWGLFQMDTIIDRYEYNFNVFMALTHYGDHALHHLFPTVDSSYLPYLYPVLKQTCKEFGMEIRVKSQLQLWLGNILQLWRVRPNPIGPDQKTNEKKSFYEMLEPYVNVKN